MRLRPGPEHPRHRSRYGTSYIHARARAVRARRSLGVRQLRRQLPRRSADEVRRYCADADLFLNLSGGSWFWRDEYARIPRKAFIDSDPAFTQLAIAKAEPWYVDFFSGFDRLFTFGANIGTRGSPVPTGDFTWRKTWQPITLDEWRTTRRRPATASPRVMTWQIESFTDVGGNKDQEFVKFIDLPARTPQRFELAINGPQSCCASTAGTRWTRWACRGRRRTTATSSSARSAEFGVAKHTYVATPIGLVQRSHGVLPGVGPARARAGHRLDRAPAARRGAAGVLDPRGSAGRHRPHQRRLRAARAARRGDRARALRRRPRAAAAARGRHVRRRDAGD